MATPDLAHYTIEVLQVRDSTGARGPRVDEYRITVAHVGGRPPSDAFTLHVVQKLYPLPTSAGRRRRDAYAEAAEIVAPGVCRLRIVAPGI